MSFKYENATTCIRSNDLTAIAQAVTHLLEQEEGCHCISQPPQPTDDLEQLYYHPEYTASNLWMVGLFPRDNGWTIVKTWHYGLFCQRAAGANRPRLPALAMQLGCNAFHFWVNRSLNGILLEADAIGRTFTSGCVDIENDDSSRFYEEPIDAPGMTLKQFSLLKVSEALQAAMRVNEDPELERKRAEHKQLLWSKNPDPDLLLELDIEVAQGYAERIDHALAKVIDSSESCWYLLNLVYNAYAKPERLEVLRAQLLYFQPPITYKPPRPYIRPTPKPLSGDEGEEF